MPAAASNASAPTNSRSAGCATSNSSCAARREGGCFPAPWGRVRAGAQRTLACRPSRQPPPAGGGRRLHPASLAQEVQQVLVELVLVRIGDAVRAAGVQL